MDISPLNSIFYYRSSDTAAGAQHNTLNDPNIRMQKLFEELTFITGLFRGLVVKQVPNPTLSLILRKQWQHKKKRTVRKLSRAEQDDLPNSYVICCVKDSQQH